MRSRRLERTAASVLALWLLVPGACAPPEEPPKPTLPGSDAGSETGAPVAGPCSGVANGTACEGDKICVHDACIEPACGDGIVTAPEECDLGSANAPGSGCEADCRFSCVPDDPARGCAAAEACIGAGVCDPVKHACSQGAPLAPGATCGDYKICVGASCTAASCGDAVSTSPERCDNGLANGPGKGCEVDCTFSCEDAATDCAPVPCNTVSCSSSHVCAATPDPAENGQPCGGGKVCSNGACVVAGAACGNGVKEGGEDCDFGAESGANTGCEANCRFSCTTGSCIDPDPCHAPPTCESVTVGAETGHRCVTGATKADGAACGTGSVCRSGTCVLSACGDGFRDDARGEECDDGNLANLDACSSSCKFEQSQRAIAMRMQFDVDAFCTANAMGRAIASAARSNMQQTIDEGVADGSISALFTFDGDLSGQSGPVTVGSVSGTPHVGTGYDGNDDLDWWYAPDPLTYDGARVPTARLTGTFTAGVLDVTGKANLTMSIGGSLTLLRLSPARLRATVGSMSVPATADASTPRGHVAAERLSPTLQSFAAMGGTGSSIEGAMCGAVSAASLIATSVPSTLRPGGSNACIEGYSEQNRVLDLFVTGCRVSFFGLPIAAIAPTQPDTWDPTAPAVGAGGPYRLTADSATKRVTECRDKDGVVVNLTACLNAAAYSSYFKLATDRVIIK